MVKHKQKILIVDDAEMNREILSEMLKDEYEILEAENGQKALDILSASHKDLQLVLLDMNMPVMSGEEVLKIMKDRLWLERLPVICISSDSTEQTIRKAYDLGVTDYFSRPFDAAVVKRRVYNTIVLYDKNGGDFNDAIGVLSIFFYRILKVNLSTGNYLVFKDGDEDVTGMFEGISDIYDRLASFAWKGYVHEDDREEYLKFCDGDWLRQQFAEGKDHLIFHYRRNITGEFRWVSMEIFRSSEYTDENQVVLIYVRDINDDYLKQLDVVMRRTTDTIGIVTLNITKDICIASSAQNPAMKILDSMENIEDYVERISENIVSEEERKQIVRHLNRDYLLQCYSEGRTTLTRDVAVYNQEKDELCMIKGTIEMIENSVSEDIEGILYFVDDTGVFLAEQMTRRLYQKNFEQVLVIDSRKNTVMVDTPDKFSTGNYRGVKYDYDRYVREVLAESVPEKERDILFHCMDLDRIHKKLEKEGRYSFTIHQTDAADEKRLKNYTFVDLSRNFGMLLGAVEDITEISRKDILTGGCNRQGFIYQAKQYLRGEDKESYAILFFNVRNFKATNDLFGMEFGDGILREIYKNLEKSPLNPLITARVEADHFICLIRKENLNFETITQLCRMKITERQRFVLAFLCCGIYCVDKDGKDIGEMIDLAKVAKKYIEDEYVQPYKLYDESMKEAYIDKMKLVEEMESGIRNEEFLIYYQPVVDAVTGKIRSAEALVRWIHPEKGFISPGVFIPALEENGHITRLDQYVAKKVRDFLKERKRDDKVSVPISINLSWMDFYDEKIIGWIIEELKNLREQDIRTRIEITETSYAAINQDRNPILNEMKENGAELLMDDFGSGYSSFGMLQDYNFDILKIDMSFVRQIETSKKTRGILKAIIDMGHTLGMKLIAEGVESKEQADFLRDNGCDYIQGYYYYRPLPEEEFRKLLDDQSEE